MRFMNEWGIEEAQSRYRHHPVKRRAARIIKDLMLLTDSCSDGWPYWSAPCKSAAKLMELIEDAVDPTEADLRAACTPIKAMLTRHAQAFGGRTIAFDDPPPRPRLSARAKLEGAAAILTALGTDARYLQGVLFHLSLRQEDFDGIVAHLRDAAAAAGPAENQVARVH